MVKKCIVSSCIIMRDKKILVLKHKKLNKWLMPGGHMEEGEIPVETAIREAKEETGFKVRLISKNVVGLKAKHSVEQPAPLCTIYEHVYYKDGMHMHFDLLYLGKPVGRQGRLAKGESKELRWISPKDIGGLDTYENVKSTLRYAFKVSESGPTAV